MSLLDLANRCGIAASAAAAALALSRPGLMTAKAGIEPGRFYSAMYASRAIPLAAGAWAALRGADGPRTWLLALGSAQAADALIGIRTRQLGMVLGPALLAAVHIGSAVRGGRPSPTRSRPRS